MTRFATNPRICKARSRLGRDAEEKDVSQGGWRGEAGTALAARIAAQASSGAHTLATAWARASMQSNESVSDTMTRIFMIFEFCMGVMAVIEHGQQRARTRTRSN